VDLDTFLKAQKKLSLNHKNEPQRVSSPYLLSGLLMCACGRRRNGRKDSRDSKKTYHYYYCNNAKVSGVCNSKNVRCDIVDREVFDVLSGSFVLDYIIQLDRKIHEDLKTREQEREERLNAINKLITANNKKIDNLVKTISLTEDLDTQKTFIKEIEKLKRENKTALSNAEEIELEENTEIAERERIVKIFKHMNGQLFDSVSFENKREFFKKFIERVVFFDKDNIDIYIKFSKKIIKKVEGAFVESE
ncbi:MAG: recombinase zinc beta ribbon domain-containing protein, partial [Firmicutes bacterium]|nr:recombinase zinc beta ribbon domain-containing protein [Bacillota bacterium]